MSIWGSDRKIEGYDKQAVYVEMCDPLSEAGEVSVGTNFDEENQRWFGGLNITSKHWNIHLSLSVEKIHRLIEELQLLERNLLYLESDDRVTTRDLDWSLPTGEPRQ